MFEILVDLTKSSSGRNIVKGIEMIYISAFNQNHNADQFEFQNIIDPLKEYLLQDVKLLQIDDLMKAITFYRYDEKFIQILIH